MFGYQSLGAFGAQSHPLNLYLTNYRSSWAILWEPRAARNIIIKKKELENMRGA